MKERSLLMIAYKFPPMQSISCNRTWSLAREFRRYFKEVFVVTTSNRHVLSQDPRDLSGLHVTDARTIDYRTLFQGNRKPSVVPEKTKVSAFGKLAARLQSSFPSLRIFGEGSFLYIRNGIKEADHMIGTHHITHIFSTFSPYADHLIAHRLKQKYPHLVWIADFRDLHVDPAQDNLFSPRYQKKINQEILRSADLVTTVSEGLASHLRDLHPRVVVLRNGIASQEVKRMKPYEHFTIGYTGSMFQDKRNPAPVLKALAALRDAGTLPAGFRILHAGKDGAVWKEYVRQAGVEDLFEDRGLVSRAEAIDIQQKSHLNLLLTYSTPGLKGNLTGKLADYLAAGRPILVLVNGPRDPEIEEVMHRSQAGRVFYNDDIKGIMEFIRLYCILIHEGKEPQIAAENLDALTWPVVIDTFMAQNFQFSQIQEAETA